MLPFRGRLPRRFVLLLAAIATLQPAIAQKAALANPLVQPTTPWLYRGSDIPPDQAWVFGEMPNGLRYAVRRNGVPPRQVTIRLAIDAGSLHERDSESGFAHFNEHLSFRGSKYVPDGEAKRLWQRLGATFGSDTNAQTTPTQTIYKLDLPSATPEGLEESVKVLSGMMAAPDITQAEVDAERRTVLAELREGAGAGQRVGDATRQLFFAGQALGTHSPIGDVPSLNAATPATLRAFHDRWYRPERATLVIVGDADTAVFEGLIKKYFADWKGKGPTPPNPDFGKPDMNGPRSRVIVEPGMPLLISLAVLRPWVSKNDTIEYNRGKLIESLALRIISRRLETRARAGGSFLDASADQDDVSRSVDGTFVRIVPLGDDWQAAVRDVRSVIADALVNPSSQEDIDREANEFLAALQASVEQASVQSDADLGDTLVEAVNIRETVASPEVARDVFANMKDRLTPAAILAATKRMFTGTPMRALLTTPKTLPDADAKLLTAVTEEAKPGAARAALAPVSFDRLPKLGAPGKVAKRSPMSALGVDYIEFENGVRLVLFASPAESGRVYVNVRFGHGVQSLPAKKPTVAWAGNAALIQSGIGDLHQDELDRLTSGRRINMAFETTEDAFQMRSVTRASDLNDQLRLLATKLQFPGWDPAPVARVRAGMLTGYASMSASPSGVIGRELPGLLHGGDPRWASPDAAQLSALTPKSFRKLWEPLLKTGPIEVMIFGDVDSEKAIAAAARTFGALPSRKDPGTASASRVSKPVGPNATPRLYRHTGADDQAAAVLAWPTSGGIDDVYESRKLDILSAIFNDRLFDQLREAEGASYSPNVSSQWPIGMAGTGSIAVVSQIKPDGVDSFFTLARKIAADLASQPVTADELARSVGPMRQMIARASSGNSFWMSQLGGSSFDPKRIAALISLSDDYGRITPAELQVSAKRWLVPDKSFSMVVLPEKAAAGR